MTVNNSVPTPEQARADLVATLDAIEDKLNVPKQIGLAVDRGRVKFARLKRDNPAALVAGIATVSAVVGLGVWAVVRSFTK